MAHFLQRYVQNPYELQFYLFRYAFKLKYQLLATTQRLVFYLFQGILLRNTAENVLDPKAKLEGIRLENSKIRFTPSTHILEALKNASDLQLDVLGIVENETNKFIGAVRKTALLSYFAQMHSVHANGSILTLSMAERDYSLNEIARIVESNGAKILGVFSEIKKDDPYTIIITLKINLTDISRIIAALQRHNFTISYFFHEEEFQSTEKDRLEHLLKFLAI